MMSDGYWTNTARSWLGQGLAMGWGDELEARLRTLSGDETYEEELAAINESYNQYSAENPGASLTGEIVGGFIPTAAALIATPFTGGATAPVAAASGARTVGALTNIANKAKQAYKGTVGRNAVTTGTTTGLTTGAVTGAGMAPPDNRSLDAIISGGLGGAIGFALPMAGRGATAVFGFIRDRLQQSGQYVDDLVLKKVYDAVGANGGTPQDVLNMISRDAELGVPTTVANVNEKTLRLADSLNTAGRGDVPEIIQDKLVDVQSSSRDRVIKQTTDALGEGKFYDQQDALITNLRSGANKAYDEAYQFGKVDDPRILNLLKNNPNFKEAFKRAQIIAQNEADADILAGGDGSAFKLIPYEIVTKGGKPSINMLPDVRTLDYIKRGLDDLIRKGFDGTGMAPAQANSLKKLKNEFVNVLDEVTEVDGVSAYANARKVYAGDMEVIEALDNGFANFGKMAPEEVSKAFENMSEGEAQAFLTGASRNLLDKLTKSSNNANYAQRIIGSPDMRKKIQMLFPAAGEEGLALYEAALLREAQLFKEIGRITGGSPTAQREAGKAAIGEGSTAGDVMADAVSTTGLTSALVQMVSKVIRQSTLPATTQERMARMLMSDNPEDVAIVVQALEDFGKRKIPKDIALNRRETANIIGAASLPGKSGPDKTPTIEEISEETTEIETPDSTLVITDEMRETYPNLFGN